MKYEVQHNRALSPLEEDGGKDVEIYNKALSSLDHATWMNVDWLYAECYIYRRIHTFFAASTKWRTYDVFSGQKISTFRSSRPAVLELATRYKDLITKLEEKSDGPKRPAAEVIEAEKLLFIEMCEICLWGNATDLSLLTSLSYDDIQKLQGSSARKASEKNILVNDLPKAYDVLRGAKHQGKEDRQIHIILDNAGFELYVDLILAGYLISSGLATRIVLECKRFPWFVSDVIPADFAQLIDVLRDPQAFFTASASSDTKFSTSTEPLLETELSSFSFLFQHLTSLHADNQITLRSHPFWTFPHSYHHLPAQAPDLYADLEESELVILKGDLNYRKLVADAMWDPTTPFNEAIGPLGEKDSGFRVLTLRTCKADTVVGLPEGKDEELRDGQGGGEEEKAKRKWAWSGKWAVVQFWDGKGQVG